ncbi:B-cell receptor-associated protein [Parasponia andersonii]|uniref:B-cell receptor-associated protein n=1 Tax=Parasponia andersonii TaxID=3476 RepID=A0A2P5BFT7_PARAD|nr:B-cell receptor-associated protein [Parasponia andersonii]
MGQTTLASSKAGLSSSTNGGAQWHLEHVCSLSSSNLPSSSFPSPVSSSLIVELSSLLSVDIYWKNEHRLMCTSEICTAAERDRYKKSASFV